MFQVTQDVKNKYSEENKQRQEKMMRSSIEAKDYQFTHERDERFLTQNAKAKLGDQEMTVQQVWGQAFLDQYKNYYSGNLYNSEGALNYEDISRKTELTKEKINQIRNYSQENTGRTDKRRKHHVQRTNHYANQLLEKRQEFLSTNDDFIQKKNQYDNTKKDGNFNEKDYAKLCSKKLKLELELIEDNYKVELHALKIEGNRDEAENKKLDEMRKVCLAKKIGCLNNMKAEAVKHPKYISEKDIDKQIKALEKEFFQLNANEQLTEEEKVQRSKDLYKVESKIKKRIDARNDKIANEERIKFYSDNYKNEIEATKSYLLSECPEEELNWRKEFITDKWIAEVQADVKSNAKFMKDNPNIVLDNAFLFKANCLRALYYKKTELSLVDSKELSRVGVTDKGLDRTVRSQLKPVRRMKNGSFASHMDEENEMWNRKWIESYSSNDMAARKECIKDNIEFMLNTKLTSETITTPDDLLNNLDELTRLERIALCQSNLASKAEFNDDALANNNLGIYKELETEMFHPQKVEGADYDERDYLRDDFAILTDSFEEQKALDIAEGKIMTKPVGKEYRDYLKSKTDAYKEACKQAK